ALAAISARLRANPEEVLAANQADVARAEAARGTDPRITPAFVDRLKLDKKRLESLAGAVDDVIKLDDPVGEITGMKRRPNGLLVGQVRAPLGVIALIYESRPNVTIDAAALCVKSGNAIVLRSGSEAARSSVALAELARNALSDVGL